MGNQRKVLNCSTSSSVHDLLASLTAQTVQTFQQTLFSTFFTNGKLLLLFPEPDIGAFAVKQAGREVKASS